MPGCVRVCGRGGHAPHYRRPTREGAHRPGGLHSAGAPAPGGTLPLARLGCARAGWGRAGREGAAGGVGGGGPFQESGGVGGGSFSACGHPRRGGGLCGVHGGCDGGQSAVVPHITGGGGKSKKKKMMEHRPRPAKRPTAVWRPKQPTAAAAAVAGVRGETTPI